MFYCAICSERYKLEDVKAGRYFVSTGVCLSCYQKMYKNKATCFGSEKLHDPKSLGCQACPDRRICAIFISHPHDSMKER